MRHPEAPKELDRLAFLVGAWRGTALERRPDGSTHYYRVARLGRFILEGWAIADEYRQWDASGRLVVLGETYRAYDAASRKWVMKWFDGLGASWLDLGPDDLGGIRVGASEISLKHHLPPRLPAGLFPPGTIFRNTFSHISDEHFTWRAEVSRGGHEPWLEVQTIESYRERG